MAGKPCPPDCQCGKHFRSSFHNEMIGRGVRRAAAMKLNEKERPTP